MTLTPSFLLFLAVGLLFVGFTMWVNVQGAKP